MEEELLQLLLHLLPQDQHQKLSSSFHRGDDHPLHLLMEGNLLWQWHGGPHPSTSVHGEEVPPPARGGAVRVLAGGDPAGLGDGTRRRKDRSKTIVSERKRRVRMKETLYQLRSLVPNITKMDKASIIADAVAYVKNLQSRARKLEEEVAALEARPRTPTNDDEHDTPPTDDEHAGSTTGPGAGERVMTRVVAAQVGEGRFCVTVECEERPGDGGVAAPLFTAVESLLPFFRMESSSLRRTAPGRVASTLTLMATDQHPAEATIVKLWVMTALLEAGFRPPSTADIT